MEQVIQQRRFKVFHLFGGSGAGALGFKQATDEYKGIQGAFQTLGSVDNNPLACQDFKYLTGVPATCLDIFERRDYIAFHAQAIDHT